MHYGSRRRRRREGRGKKLIQRNMAEKSPIVGKEIDIKVYKPEPQI